MVAVNRISSDCTQLLFTLESELNKKAPHSAWRIIAPTSYGGDFGANVEYMNDETIGSGRAPKKGVPVKKTVGAAFEASLRQLWAQYFITGLMANVPKETGSTWTIKRAGYVDDTQAKVTAATATGYTGSGFNEDNGFKVEGKPLLFASGFDTANNNGLKVLTAVTATSITAGTGTIEASPPDPALQIVGMETASATQAVVGNIFRIAQTSLGEGGFYKPDPGTFIFFGGDAAANQSSQDSNLGFARVDKVTTAGLDCNLTTFEPTAQATESNAVHVFLPTRIMKDDVKCGNQLRTTFQLERILDVSDTDFTYPQSQLVTGAVVNQMDMSIPTGGKIGCNFSFVAAESCRYKGGLDTVDDSEKPRSQLTSVDPIGLDPSPMYNTTMDVKYAQLYRYDYAASGSSKPANLFGLVTEATVTVNNNCTPVEGLGIYGAHEINYGALNIEASLTALFTTTEALDLAEEGIDAGLYIICAQPGTLVKGSEYGAGLVIDIPLLTVQNSPLEVSTGEPVKLSLSNTGNTHPEYGYAISFQFFDYLPKPAVEYDFGSCS